MDHMVICLDLSSVHVSECGDKTHLESLDFDCILPTNFILSTFAFKHILCK